MACVSTALVVGGGIAGLSAAIALSQTGVHCDVVELAEAPGGASLALSGRATEALDELGVYDECCARGTPFHPGTTAADQLDAAGRLISRGPTRPRWPGAKTPVGIHRPVLLTILEEAARRLGVEIRRGVTTLTADDRDDGVLVTTTDGREARYDLVVGADGIGSRTRARLFPDGPEPAYAGQYSLRWMTSGPPIEGEGWYLGPVGRLGFYHLPGGLIYVPAVVAIPERVHLTDEDVHALFTRLLDSYTAPAVVEMRRRLTPDADLIGRPFEWILLSSAWHRGRTILIGDAAHATTAHMGMGGGMAIEDAVVLARCVSAATTVAEAFDTFMDRRRARVTTVVETSVELSRLEREGAPASANVELLSTAFQTLGRPY
ncbi:FAD-dependent monooxygenase [Umezawaea tangerina]|uniref:2-polyprenyl-6-methoxyphenol hydroxylase-like FAD-dependent oxidoreductase n=1 Tax=Umezawaea tangerina TaxID=84725 RepID=A0A2T0STK2_9PSEU|nr:FAD-dependent monooxygenase [Umezawaea tangerina]PRY36746.1 2-polyprenyl-6-methoxyphenol hydroxylase-like FAD-dependent oxidoreductase [Umezawaea tangerina]